MGQINNQTSSSAVQATSTVSGLVKQTVFNVKDYGAVGDGVTDDTTAIQVTINAANAAGGGVVELPISTYATTAPINILSNVTLRGSGSGKSILYGADLDYIMLQTVKSGTTKNIYSNICIKDLTIKSQRGYCMKIDNTTNISILNNEFFFAATPFIRECLMIEHCSYAVIDGNYLHNTAGDGIQVNSTDYFVVSNNNIVGGTQSDDAIDIDKDFVDTALIPSRWGTITANTVNNIPKGNGIRVGSCKQITVSSNIISNITGITTSAILVNSYDTDTNDPGCSNITVIGNTIDNCVSTGVNVSGNNVINVNIIGNVISYVGTISAGNIRGAISLNSSAISVVGNTVINSGNNGGNSAGIIMYKKGFHFISENFIQNCPIGLAAWNGSGTEIYLQTTISNNKMLSNTINYNSDVFTQSGIKVLSSTTNGWGFGIENDSSAYVQIQSTTQGFLPPRMTTTQRTAIASPAAGLMVWDTTVPGLYVYSGTAWKAATLT